MNFKTNRLITIDQHIANEKSRYPQATGEFSSLLHDIALAARVISREVRRAGLNEMLGLTGVTNIHGEQVKKLDKFSNEIIKNLVLQNESVCCLASEEEDEIVFPENSSENSKYVLVYDPLDGSTNIDVNITIGSIFSIYRRKSISIANVEDVLQSGINQVAAGYILYGSSTMLVYTTGNGVDIFTYDPTLGEFLLTKSKIKIPSKGYIYSCNEGNYYKWRENIRRYVEYLKSPKPNSKPYMLRYIASGVADIHRTLHYGGVYLYPEDTDNPNGKFRLVYEANALAMIVEQAGGKATNGKQRILDVTPSSIHQRTPLIIGSPEEVFLYEKYYNEIM